MQQNMQNATEVQEVETPPTLVDRTVQHLYMEGQISKREAIYWDTLAQVIPLTQDAANAQ